MKRRFKTKKKKHKLFLILISLMLIYIFFNLSYNLVYNLYLSKLSNEEIIKKILNDTKNNKVSKLFFKYQDPKEIVGKNFVLKDVNDSDDIVVNNKDDKDLVYIYSTHDTESYSYSYFELYNIKPTVKTVSYILKDYLSDLGIMAHVEDRLTSSVLKERGWSYRYSYQASREIIEQRISANNYKLIIDLHRDSSVLDKTLLDFNGKKYARILFVVGAEYDNYQENYQVATKLNQLLEEEIPGISRGISKKSGEGVNGIYNQDLNKNMVLLEVGGQYNEIEELNNTILLLSKVILRYLEDEI